MNKKLGKINNRKESLELLKQHLLLQIKTSQATCQWKLKMKLKQLYLLKNYKATKINIKLKIKKLNLWLTAPKGATPVN